MAADSEVNGASHVNEALFAPELLQQFVSVVCVLQLSTSVRSKHVPRVHDDQSHGDVVCGFAYVSVIKDFYDKCVFC